MKSTELRLGNYVYKINTYDGTKCTHSFEVRDFHNIDGFEPIPLTEEWLLNLGFTRFGDWYIIDDELSISLFNNRSTYGNEHEQEINHVKYVHQLQNLYFALTGEELTLNSEI